MFGQPSSLENENHLGGGGRSNFLKSSLEGALATLGGNGSANFESPFENGGSLSNRPSKPKVDPFKKFDNFPKQQSGFRTSFDETTSQKRSLQSSSSVNQLGYVASPSSLPQNFNQQS